MNWLEQTAREFKFELVALDVLSALQEIDEPHGSFLAEIIELYLDVAPKTIASLRKAVKTKTNREIFLAAHGLKSSSANVGALRVTTLCRKIELAMNTNAAPTRHDFPDLCLQIQNEFLNVSRELKIVTCVAKGIAVPPSLLKTGLRE